MSLGNIFSAILGTAKEPTIFREALPSIGQGILSYIAGRGGQKGEDRQLASQREFQASQAELNRQHEMQMLLSRLAQQGGSNQQEMLLRALLGAAEQQQQGAGMSAGILQRIADQVRGSIT